MRGEVLSYDSTAGTGLISGDDGARYAALLDAAGVPVELHLAETLVHGYLGYAGIVPAATEATERGLQALRAALA